VSTGDITTNGSFEMENETNTGRERPTTQDSSQHARLRALPLRQLENEPYWTIADHLFSLIKLVSDYLYLIRSSKCYFGITKRIIG
jgi:hypothetical protein